MLRTGLRRKEEIVSLLSRHLPFSSQARLGTVPRSPLAKAGLKACPENTSRPPARDWIRVRRTVWRVIPQIVKRG
jgi:hypothetical protein